MPNSLVQFYRNQLASEGKTDDRTDYEITQQFGQFAQAKAPELFHGFPDFADEYDKIREANAPSLAGEFGKTLKGGTEGMASTYTGVGALAGIPGAAGAAKSLEEASAENAPTIPTMEDIAPGQPTLKRVFSKDTARYLTGKVGGIIPSVAEMIGLATAGAVAGSAAEPGVGTVSGAVEGAAESVFDRGIIKSAIKSLLEKGEAEKSLAEKMAEKGLIEDASEEGIKSAITSGSQGVADIVTQQAKALAGQHASNITNLINAYAMSAGGIYDQTGRRDLALELGAVGAAPMALPEFSLPTQFVRKLFPKLSGDAAQQAANDLVKQKTTQLLTKLGVAAKATLAGTGNMVAMEAANVVADNLSAGRDALSLTPDQWKQLREAAIGGALASAPAGAFVGFRGESRPAELTSPSETPSEIPSPETPPTVAAAEPAPTSQEPPTDTATLWSNINAMTPEEKQSRLADLTAKAMRTPAEENERLLLGATTPRTIPSVAAPLSEENAPPPAMATGPAATEPVTAPAGPGAVLKPLPPSTRITVHGRNKAGEPVVQIDIPGEDPSARPIFSGSPEEAAAAGYSVPSMAVGEVGVPVIERSPTEAGTYGALHFTDAGFKTHEDFLEAYRKDGVHDVFETPEEFLSRLYCMGQSA